MENELKIKYNGLLEDFRTGTKFVEENPNNEKAQARLMEIGKEMESVLQSIGNFTAEEADNGFKVETIDTINEQAQAQVVKQSTSSGNTKAITIKQENSIQGFGNNWKFAEQLSKSDLVPDTYKNKPQNVIIAIGLANQMQLDPFTVMQNLAIIKGKTSWSGSFCKTLIERTGKFKNLELNYIGEKGKDSYGCYLSAERVSDGKIINGPSVTMQMAKTEGWTSNKKWNTLTDLMLGYRCQSFFCRLYTPEAMNGIYTSEEVEDITPIREQPQDIL